MSFGSKCELCIAIEVAVEQMRQLVEARRRCSRLIACHSARIMMQVAKNREIDAANQALERLIAKAQNQQTGLHNI